MKKLRIAQVTNLQESVPPLNKNGLEQIVYYLTEELVKLGHDVTLFASADSQTSAHLFPIWPQAVSRDPFGPKLSPETYTNFAIAQAFKHHGEFDIIHDHTRFEAPYFSSLIQTPVVSTIHHPLDLLMEGGYKQIYPKEYEKYFFQNWQEFTKNVHNVVVSQFQKNHYLGNCSVIPNGLNLEDFKFENTPNNYLCFLGYISPNKGAAEAIQAILPTSENLMIAGPIRSDDPAAKIYFDEKIAPFLNDRIKYVGPLGYKEKIDFLSKAKATLMPIQWDEPFGLVAIESMACGTPVIGWNRAALPEIIENGVSGFLVNSIEEMTERINQISSLSRSSARKRVEENFTAIKMTEKYVDLYNRIT